ncbi:hypothetical protein BDZ94DRAFT_1298003 [Collybia nuda]|uniref:Plus3 domain-containing protein n=1 Tax=Collybia nuda TaxID=64659 RepID=A0A9P5Y8H6_9AGAR|nr:hypothetical protein BDZ94DRAFT_1298003 [Collybia nuda]
MSDFEDDIDDELLELAGATEKKRKRRQTPSKSSASKKRKADVSMETDSEVEGPESEEEDIDPYPLDGKYVDETDRQRLMQMSEIDREDIITQRLEEKQRLQDKRLISQMVKEQRLGENESVSKAAKRQHAVRGATKEKSRKLDELKARRKAKDEKQRTKGSPKRDRSSSPMDMEISDEESEDGQITRLEQEEEKDRKLLSKIQPVDDQPITMEDLEKCRLTRDLVAKSCMAPWFQEYIQGSWVRYLIGHEDGQMIYRICQVSNLGADLVKPYKINDKTVNQTVDLKHGKSERTFNMDKISNAAFLPKEFERLVKVCTAEEVKLPTRRDLEKKITQMNRLIAQPVTESDINAMLARKSQLQVNKPLGLTTMEKSRLNQARTLAQRRHDFAEVAEIDAQLAELAASTTERHNREPVDLLAKVNERNRKANMEAVRKAEIAESERKRRERKHGKLTTDDPSARLKTIPRLFNANTPTTRPGTPNQTGTPLLNASGNSTPRPISPLPSSLSIGLNGTAKTFEAAVIDSIEVDLGDF